MVCFKRTAPSFCFVKEILIQCLTTAILVCYYLVLGLFGHMIADTVRKRTHSNFKARAAYVLSIFLLIALTVSML